MMPAALDTERTATILTIAAAAFSFLSIASFVRAVRDAHAVRRRLQAHQSLAIASNRRLSCQLCHELHDTLLAVPLADAEELTWLCAGCRAVLVPAGVGS